MKMTVTTDQKYLMNPSLAGNKKEKKKVTQEDQGISFRKPSQVHSGFQQLHHQSQFPWLPR